MTPRARREELGLPAYNAPARAHLAWLLDNFVYSDIDAMPLARRHALHEALGHAVRAADIDWVATGSFESADGEVMSGHEVSQLDRFQRGRFRPSDPTADLRAAQTSAKEAAELLSRGGYYTLRAGAEREDGDNAVVRPLRILHAEFSAPPVNKWIYMPLADAVVMTILTAMSITPFAVVRRCPYSLPDGSRCDRVFVAVRAQQYCRPHGVERRREQNRAALEKHRTKKAAKKRRRG